MEQSFIIKRIELLEKRLDFLERYLTVEDKAPNVEIEVKPLGEMKPIRSFNFQSTNSLRSKLNKAFRDLKNKPQAS